jgi:beta-lactamase regulating signal transducer with metallopeptidase domain
VVEANFGAVAESENNSALGWILPLIILALLLALGFMFCSKSEPIADTVNMNVNQSAISVNSNSVVNVNK